MDAITGFVYGMSMMFFSMMAWMFWRKGSDRLFRLIMILMLIVDAQCLKDILSFYFTGFDNEENWFLISAADMLTISISTSFRCGELFMVLPLSS